jgi:UDP-N-acetylmuramate dehydrogenase
MQHYQNYDLTPYNTLGLPAIAEHFFMLDSIDEVENIHESYGMPSHILWGWSNILIQSSSLSKVWHPTWDTITLFHESHQDIILEVGAWMARDDLVQYTISHGRRGIENLIAIPGSVGAAPVQNIGAYGIELKDVFVSCDAYHFPTQSRITYDASACQFGYRDSMFKQHPGEYCIGTVRIRLSKNPQPRLTYGAITDTLFTRGIDHPTQAQIAETIAAIRRSKLPRPSELGNTGSFFQNPVVPTVIVHHLLELHPAMPHFPTSPTTYKIPAARLIEQAGAKWYREWSVGTYPLQPLVIVNYGWATGGDVYNFSTTIIQRVQETFGVILTREVNVW